MYLKKFHTFHAEEGFESYRIYANGTSDNDADDPYDYVYQNLPNHHHVLKKYLIVGIVGPYGSNMNHPDFVAEMERFMCIFLKCRLN